MLELFCQNQRDDGKMSKTTKHLIIHAHLLAVWVLILVSANTTIPVLSQIQQGCPEPPFINTPPINSWPNDVWPQTKWIDVKIDSRWVFIEQKAIETGVSKWNVEANCSNVRFKDFSTILIIDYDAAPPDNTVYWQRIDPQNGGALGAVRIHHYEDLRVRASRIQIMPTATTQADYFVYLGSHETGHTFNLSHPSSWGSSIMGGHSNTSAAFNNLGPFECDFFKVNQQYPCGLPTPTPTASPTPTPPANQDDCESMNWFWNPFADDCQQDPPPTCTLLPEICENGIWSFEWCGCIPYNTPILIDVEGNGFGLSSSDSGVSFNLNNVGGREKLAWTNAASDDAWLVLDRNGNGTIDDGTELFGDVTPQPDPPGDEKKNGFRALAEYDKISNGGTANGQIESWDSVFASLRLWRDTNHDGLSEPNELHTLASQNVAALDLDYKYSKKTDVHGNQFSFRAKVKNTQGQQLGRWAWDVYLVISP